MRENRFTIIESLVKGRKAGPISKVLKGGRFYGKIFLIDMIGALDEILGQT